MAEAAIAAAKAVAAWLAKEGVKQAIVKAVISATVSYGASKLAAASNKPRPQGSLITLDLAGDAPRRVQIGQRGNGGVMADWYVADYKNQTCYIPIYLAEGPCGALTGMWANGRRVFSGTLNHGQRVQLNDFNSPDGRAWVTYYDGRPGQTADPTLVGRGLGWTSQCVGTGCAYVILEWRWDPDTVPIIPQTFFETQGSYFYDRRLDSTAGGSGSHRLKDPATWSLSTNPAVVADHFKLGRFLTTSDTEPYFGIGLPAEETWTYAEFAAMANICDENVTSKYGGFEKRYVANGFLFSDSKHKDTLLDLARAMNARPGDIGGRLVMLHGEAKTPVMVLTDGDRITGTQEQYSPKKSVNQLVQKVTGTYQDPANNYMPTNYPEVGDPAWVVEDGGEIDPTVLDLEMEISPERAQRLATMYARRMRRQATLNSVFGLKALELEDGDWFIRQGARFASGKTFEVNGSPRLDPDTLTVSISAFEVDPSDPAWDETGVLDVNVPTPASGDTIRLPLPNVSISAISYALGTIGLPVVVFTNNDFNDGAPTAVEIEIAEDDGAGAPTGTYLTHFIPIGVQASSKTGLAPGVDYVARYRSVLGEKKSLWSTWQQFTTTNTYTVPGSGVSNWADLAGRPASLTDGRVAAGLSSNGDLVRNIPLGILNGSDVLRWPSGGLYTGDLAADITGNNVALDFVGRGALATLNNFSWGSGLLTGIPTSLTDGRVAAGLAANGDLGRPIPSTIKLSSDILSRVGGGTFTGDLGADITAQNVALDFVGRGPLATLSTVDWSTYITGANRPEDNADLSPSLELTATSVVIQRDYQGNIKGGQLPGLIGAIRRKGGAEVNGSTNWTITTTNCTATIDNGSSASAGNITITAIAANNATIVVTSVRDGITLRATITFSFVDDAPPVNTASSAQDSTFTTFIGTSFVQLSDTLDVSTGPNAQLVITGSHSVAFSAPTTGPLGNYPCEVKSQYRTPGGSWIDVTMDACTPSMQFESEFGGFFPAADFAVVGGTVTGLTANSPYQVRLVARRTGTTPSKTMAITFGTFSVQGS